VNLFDEEQRQKLARDPNHVVNHSPVAVPGDSEGGDSCTGAGRMEQLTLEDPVPKGILGDVVSSPPSSKKGKRRAKGVLKKYPVDEPIIIVLDSLGLPHAGTIKALKEYILEEGRAKRSMEAFITQNAFYAREPHIPMQRNFTDCGVYLLGYVQKFFADPKTFVTRLLTREMDPQTDWPDMKAPDIRHAMRKILMSIAEQQGATKRKRKPNKNREQDRHEATQQPGSPSRTKEGTEVSPPRHAPVDSGESKSGPPAPLVENEDAPEVPRPRFESPIRSVQSDVEPSVEEAASPKHLTPVKSSQKPSESEAPDGLPTEEPLPHASRRPESPVESPHLQTTAAEESTPRSTPGRVSPKVLVISRSPEKPLKRPFEAATAHDAVEERNHSAGNESEHQERHQERSAKRPKAADTPEPARRRRGTSLEPRLSPKSMPDAQISPEGPSPRMQGTKSSQSSPGRSLRGSPVNPIEIDDSQEAIDEPTPVALRCSRQPSREEDAAGFKSRRYVAESPPWMTGHPSPVVSRPDRSSAKPTTAMQRSKVISQTPTRTTARPFREASRPGSATKSRIRDASVEFTHSRQKKSPERGTRATGGLSPQGSFRDGPRAAPIAGRRPAIRRNRDSPEFFGDNNDIYVVGARASFPSRRTRTAVSETPPRLLQEEEEENGVRLGEGPAQGALRGSTVRGVVRRYIFDDLEEQLSRG
jgi:hypothetical protein